MLHRTTNLLLLLAQLACVTFSNVMEVRAEDPPIIRIENDAPEMVAAVKKAKETLPKFWDKLENPGPGESGHAVKFAIHDAETDENEVMWGTEVQRKDGKVTVTLNNKPQLIKNAKVGDRIEIKEEDIRDWMFMRKGKMVGNFTIVPLLKSMPKKDAARLKAMMSDL
ncbi:YegJ family protein [Planctomicrobium sp. SH668]|uniref:YegJ family protein n=1 Tax=Planctomicrobium sp. SH668 TaxID=3448126 RepID=UPI003F5AED5A